MNYALAGYEFNKLHRMMAASMDRYNVAVF